MRNGYLKTAVVSAMLVVVLLFTLFGVVLATDPTASATRTITPGAVAPGQEVEITVVWQNTSGVPQAFALQETYPDGWTLTRGTDSASSWRDMPPLAEWTYFLVGVDGGDTVTYTLTVPGDAEPGDYHVAGKVIDAADTQNPVGGDETITVAVEVLYDLTMAADPGAGGTAIDLTDESPYAEDTEVSIKAQANSGYQFVNWTAPAGTFDDADATETTFTMPAQSVTVTANFEEVPPQIPTVSTQAATGITTISATLNMNFTVGDFSPVEVRFAHKKTADTAWSYTSWVDKSAAGTHAEALAGLTAGTQYSFKAELQYDETVIEGDTRSFTTAPPEVPGGFCFVATAAYGTPTAEEINVLREFRDVVLLNSEAGSRFVTWYYKASPPIADFIAKHEVLRTLVRELLIDPLVWVIESTADMWRN